MMFAKACGLLGKKLETTTLPELQKACSAELTHYSINLREECRCEEANDAILDPTKPTLSKLREAYLRLCYCQDLLQQLTEADIRSQPENWEHVRKITDIKSLYNQAAVIYKKDIVAARADCEKYKKWELKWSVVRTDDPKNAELNKSISIIRKRLMAEEEGTDLEYVAYLESCGFFKINPENPSVKTLQSQYRKFFRKIHPDKLLPTVHEDMREVINKDLNSSIQYVTNRFDVLKAQFEQDPTANVFKYTLADIFKNIFKPETLLADSLFARIMWDLKRLQQKACRTFTGTEPAWIAGNQNRISIFKGDAKSIAVYNSIAERTTKLFNRFSQQLPTIKQRAVEYIIIMKEQQPLGYEGKIDGVLQNIKDIIESMEARNEECHLNSDRFKNNENVQISKNIINELKTLLSKVEEGNLESLKEYLILISPSSSNHSLPAQQFRLIGGSHPFHRGGHHKMLLLWSTLRVL